MLQAWKICQLQNQNNFNLRRNFSRTFDCQCIRANVNQQVKKCCNAYCKTTRNQRHKFLTGKQNALRFKPKYSTEEPNIHRPRGAMD